MTNRDTNTETSFLPDFCSGRMALVVITLAELLALVLTLTVGSVSEDPYYDLALYSLFVQFIALSCAAALCFCRRFLKHLSNPVAATLSYLLMLLIAFIIIQLAWWMMHYYRLDFSEEENFFAFTFRAMTITAITSALALRYFYVQHQWRKQIRLEARSRLEALQARIRPHFFFNCMNTIASLARKDARLTEEAVENLADLFRASLQTGLLSTTLEKEIALCRQYLSIEQHRLGERLSVDWQIDDLPMQAMIPPLSLQPLLENAIYHGIEPLADGGKIEVSGKVGNNQVSIQISNPVSTNPSDRQSGNQLAQDNVRLRLQQLFNRDKVFSVEESAGHYRVTLEFPLQHENSDR